jgi:phosphoglycolate phosphatase
MALPVDPRLLLLDFDGPVCSVFSHLTNAAVADLVRGVLRHAQVWIPRGARTTDDPFIVWREVSSGPQHVSLLVEKSIRDAELIAVQHAAPTPGVEHVLAACHARGIDVVVVSNNADEAVDAYLARMELTPYVREVVARRRGAGFSTLKPNPHLIRRALAVGPCGHAHAFMLGDSESDVRAADALGVPCVGFCRNPQRAGRLRRSGAVHEIDDLGEFVALLDRSYTRLPEA